jgi:hypothetical protein
MAQLRSTRLELAMRLGVETGTLDGFSPDEHEYEITLNASDSKSALRNAVLATAPGGHCESMAFHFTEVPMPLLAMRISACTFARRSEVLLQLLPPDESTPS